MEQIALKASLRTSKGKEKSKALRAAGTIPAVVYHRGEETLPISLSAIDFSKLLRASEGENVLINLQIEGAKRKSRSVLVKEIQHHPDVTLTIDLFFIGLVFFKKDFKAKQHFVIRF